jgi:hypothetical protein
MGRHPARVKAAQGNAIFVGVLVLGVAAAWINTHDAPNVAPTTLGLVALAALTPAVAWLSRRDRPAWTTALFFAAVAIVAAQVVLRSGMPRGHDLQSHSWALYAIWSGVLDGDLWPRWTPHIGLGVPLLQFYGPLPWLLCWPALALGATPMEGLKSGLIVSQFVGAGATYAAARGLGASRPASMLAGLALAFAPYRLLDQNYRMAYAEGFAMGLTPWTLSQALRTARGEARVGALAAGTAAIIFSHPVTGLLLVPMAFPLLAGPLIRRPKRVLALLLAGGLALGGTAAFWLPMTVEQGSTTLSKTAPVGKQLAPLSAYPGELVRRQAWTTYDLRRKYADEAGRSKAVPLYVGCALLALLGLATLAPKREGAPDPRPWAIAALLAFALSTRPTAGLLDFIPLYGRIQFPWRFLAPATACAALAAGLSLDRWVSASARPWLAAVAVAALTFDAAPSLGAAQWYPDYDDVVVRGPGNRPIPLAITPGVFTRVENLRLPPASFDHRVGRTTGIFPEYSNPVARKRYLGRTPKPGRSESVGIRWRIERRRAKPISPEPLARLNGVPVLGSEVAFSGENIDVSLPVGGPAGLLRIASQDFPGWRARVDGGEWQDVGAKHGLLALPVPAGARRVELRYSAWRPWDRAAGNVVSLLMLLGGFGWWWRRP